MAEQDFIPAPVQTPQAAGGTGLDFNVGAIGQAGQAINQLLEAGEYVAGYVEKSKREAAIEETNADLTAFTATMSEMKNQYDIAISRTVDPVEIKEYTDDYLKTANDYINDPAKIRNQKGRDEAYKMIENHKAAVNNQVRLRNKQLSEADSLYKIDVGISQVVKNFMQPKAVFKDKIELLLDQKVSMGKMVEGQKMILVDQYMEKREVDKAQFVSAAFQTEVNDHARYAEDKIGHIQNDDTLTDPQKTKDISETLADYEISVKNTENIYRKDVEKSELPADQKRIFLKQIDTNLNYQRSYLSKLRSQIKDQQVNTDSDNLVRFQNEVSLRNPNVMASLETMRSYGLSNKDIASYQKGFITKKSREVQFVTDTNAIGEIADNVIHLNPQSDKTVFNELIRRAASIDDATLRSQAISLIEDRRKPERFNEPINKVINELVKQLPKDLFTRTIDIPSQESLLIYDLEFSREQIWNAIESIKAEGRSILAKKGLQPATEFINDKFGAIIDEDQIGKTIEAFYMKHTSTDKESLKDVLRRPGQGFPIVDQKTTTISGQLYRLNDKNKTLQPVKK